MSNLIIPGRSKLATALRKPRLLVPGQRPIGRVRPKSGHDIPVAFFDFAQPNQQYGYCPIALASAAQFSGGELLGNANGDLVGTIGAETTDSTFSGTGPFTWVLRATYLRPIISNHTDLLIAPANSSTTAQTNHTGVAIRTSLSAGKFKLYGYIGKSYPSTSYTLEVGVTYNIVFSRNAAGYASIWVNGALHGGPTYLPEDQYNRTGKRKGLLSTSYGQSTLAKIAFWYVSYTEYSTAELRALSLDPLALWQPANQSPLIFDLGGGGGGGATLHIKLGSTQVQSVSIGSTPIQSIYKGSTKL